MTDRIDLSWNGVKEATEHRTVGLRAWCHQDREWCYPHVVCDCCHEALGHQKVWSVPQ